MYLHVTAPSEQAQIAGTAIAGALDYDPASPPQVGVYFADGTGAKMSYFLRTKTSVTSQSCTAGAQRLGGTVTLSEVTPGPDDLTPYVTGGGHYGVPVGQQLVNVRIYGPSGAKFGAVTIDAKKIDTDVVVDRGRPVATVALLVGDKAPVNVAWAATLPTASAHPIELTVSPTMESRPAHSTVATTCGG
jgi:hypothetical protein